MKLRIWQVDAFAERPFAGNPAAIVPLKRWLPDAVMQAIANENNLAETAFFIGREPGLYDLRWFTPAAEVELCGHATIASAWVIFSELAPALDVVRFSTRSGILTVEKCADGLNRMSLPADPVAPFAALDGFAEKLGKALGVTSPDELYAGRYLMAVWGDAGAVRAITPKDDFVPLLRQTGMWGLIATGRGDGNPYDCVSRFFAPGKGVFEDPVTGSAHCAVIPFWAKRVGKTTLRAYQASARGGELLCTDEGDRVILSGACALYMRGEIEV
jgi:PhzF family phenazine biosynthesis protein